ncbi:cryptochrome/photolyase family protein [Halarchaeum grantii]|uniref:Cryptochrome/photolyase family protein n=1 Tax=Halarchaeum grantii TaxID=1193105 RepID=A0A830EWA6_9EURY|nr:cryptochrome/photolyase family protein [Halarchaeum grantii]GGL37135.1 cryptochrome/photolyase family protein [Halarchaeum grantii]
MTVLVLGDQLTDRVGPLADAPDERALMIEARAFATRHPYHPHKRVLVSSAMRHFRDELREAGRDVDYHVVDSFADGLDAHFDAHPGDALTVMRPSSHGATERLRDLVTERGGTLDVVTNETFLCTPEGFDGWLEGNRLRHEDFYRYMRRETGYLMADGDPVGGAWNYDEENRETPPDDYEPPEVPRYEPDETTREVQREWDDAESWADPEAFGWPVTRSDALDALADFCEHRLRDFGPYEDAMVGDEWALDHALLSPALNLGLLHPREVVEAAIDAYEARDDVPLASVEGFVRQVIGWREFVRHVYRRGMPALGEANRLDATRPLPDVYWDGDTAMACLDAAVDGVRKRGYAHHIQRLMVLSNFGLLYGVDPHELNRWFHVAFIDGYHWVSTPNTVEMGQYAGDRFATKPYAASANYIDRMSDHCAGCQYDPDATVGDGACPFNALYWDFLAEHESELRSNHRMGLVYAHLDDKRDADALGGIRERAAEVRRRVRDGDV